MNYLYSQPKANSTILHFAHTAAIPNKQGILAQRTRLQFEHQQYRYITLRIIHIYIHTTPILHTNCQILSLILFYEGQQNPTKLLTHNTDYHILHKSVDHTQHTSQSTTAFVYTAESTNFLQFVHSSYHYTQLQYIIFPHTTFSYTYYTHTLQYILHTHIHTQENQTLYIQKYNIDTKLFIHTHTKPLGCARSMYSLRIHRTVTV